MLTNHKNPANNEKAADKKNFNQCNKIRYKWYYCNNDIFCKIKNARSPFTILVWHCSLKFFNKYQIFILELGKGNHFLINWWKLYSIIWWIPIARRQIIFMRKANIGEEDPLKNQITLLSWIPIIIPIINNIIINKIWNSEKISRLTKIEKMDNYFSQPQKKNTKNAQDILRVA